MPDNIGRLYHIWDSIKRIEEYCKDISSSEFEKHNLIQDGCIRQLEIIGEASNHLDQEIIENFKNIPWIDIIGLRNFLIHQYFSVDVKIVWNILSDDISPLKDKIFDIIKELEND